MAARRFSYCITDTLEHPRRKLALRTLEWTTVSVTLGLWSYIVEETIRQSGRESIELFGIKFDRGTIASNLWNDHVILISIFAILHISCILLSRRSNFMKSIFGYENVSQTTELPLAILKGFFYTTVVQTLLGLGSVAGTGCIPVFITLVQVYLSFIVTTNYLFVAIVK